MRVNTFRITYRDARERGLNIHSFDSMRDALVSEGFSIEAASKDFSGSNISFVAIRSPNGYIEYTQKLKE